MAAPSAAPSIPKAALREIYIAGFIGNVSYGAYVVLAFASICYLLQRRRRTGGQNIALAYTCAMLAVTTAWVGAGARWDEVFLVDGDPSNATCSVPGIVLKVAAMLEFLLSDGLLMFRTYVVWDNKWQVVVFPTILYVMSLVSGIAMNLQCAYPALGGSTNATLHEVFFAATIVCNAFSTAAIAARFAMHRRALRGLGLAATEYTTVAGVLAESAALYALVGTVYLPLYVLQLPAASAVSSVFGALSFISPAVIILRVALGISYDRRPPATATPWYTTGGDDAPTELSPETPHPPEEEDMPPAWSSPLASWMSEKAKKRSSANEVQHEDCTGTSSRYPPRSETRTTHTSHLGDQV